MKNIIQSLKVVALGLMLAIGLSYAFAWTAPTGNPPTGNVSAPVNVGDNTQYKEGSLVLNTSTTPFANGLIVRSGNVGIGTTDPKINLAIGDNDTGFKWISDGNLAVYTNNTERMRIDNGGNVGIGTTNPEAKLQIVDGGLHIKGIQGAPSQGVAIGWNHDKGSGATWLINNAGLGQGGFNFDNVKSGKQTRLMTLDATGNLTAPGTIKGSRVLNPTYAP